MGLKHDRGASTVVRCRDFEDFLRRVRKSRFVATRIFRGQRDIQWKLVSPWDRILEKPCLDEESYATQPFRRLQLHPFSQPNPADRLAIRDGFLDAFRDSVIGLQGVTSESLKEQELAWALGRHHGLVTPLLDWSLSPAVALFFACFDHIEFNNPGFMKGLCSKSGVRVNDKEPIAVWELALSREFLDKDQLKTVMARVDHAYRQKAQRGVFTYLNHSEYLDIESYLANLGLAPYLSCYQIPGSEVGRVLWNLKLMGITYANLFPDLDGAAIDANTAMALEDLENQYAHPEDMTYEIDDL